MASPVRLSAPGNIREISLMVSKRQSAEVCLGQNLVHEARRVNKNRGEKNKIIPGAPAWRLHVVVHPR
jgi:hypothetical protein